MPEDMTEVERLAMALAAEHLVYPVIATAAELREYWLEFLQHEDHEEFRERARNLLAHAALAAEPAEGE